MRSDEDKKLISICVPLFNEVDNVAALYERLADVAKSIKGRYNIEFMFSDNHCYAINFPIFYTWVPFQK